MTFRKREITVLVVVMLLFSVIFVKYFVPTLIREYRADVLSHVTQQKLSLSSRFQTCADNEVRTKIEGGFICVPKELDDSVWTKIYTSYPLFSEGKQLIYEQLSDGEIAQADLLLQGEVPIERFDPVYFEELNWDEDPYQERYWRFLYLSLRPARHLIYAANTTHDAKYYEGLRSFITSYIDNGLEKEETWEDFHAVAFRSMVLTNSWWTLRSAGELDYETSTKILQSIEKHGWFLRADEHFQTYSNHGINEAAALLLIPVSFPHLPGAGEWYEVANGRLTHSLTELIDDDGALIENSPYYHFYALDKYWAIKQFAQKQHLAIAPLLEETVESMIHYATYVLEPNSSVPLLGASIETNIITAGTYKEMVREYPEFRYVLSSGSNGQKPKQQHISFEDTGHTIMRSGWGKGSSFVNQTQLIFDVGDYRTNHSDLDALSFNLYDNGKTLLTDAGLFTYESGDSRDYFHGTRGHNTVLVDDSDQLPWGATAGELIEGDGYVTQSASHSLYPGVQHQRAMTLLGKDLVLIVDHLISSTEHSYKQLFHFNPDLEVQIDGDTVTATGASPDHTVTLYQLSTDGMEIDALKGEEGAGWCSSTYEVAEPCYEVQYKKNGDTTSFITLIAIGKGTEQLSSSYSENLQRVIVTSKQKTYEIDINAPDSASSPLAKITTEEVTETVPAQLRFDAAAEDGKKWTLTSQDSNEQALSGWELIETDRGTLALKKTSGEIFPNDRLAVDIEGVTTSATHPSFIDLPIITNPLGSFLLVPEQEDVLPILGYHNVLDDNDPIENTTLDIHESDFYRQIEYLTNEVGCNWYTLADLVENYMRTNTKLPRNACAINFDDGSRNHFTRAFPILETFGAKSTFYVISGRLSSTNNYMTWEMVDELYRHGHEIGSHTIDSGGLITEGWNYEQLLYQLGVSKQILTARGYDVTTFAYPWGEVNEEIVRAVKESGYSAGRENEKSNKWRDLRPNTTGFSDDYLFDLNYYKPELKTLDQLKADLTYTGYWQFEERYEIVDGNDQTVVTRSSEKPTDQSFATVELQNGSAIRRQFVVSQDGEYSLSLFTNASPSQIDVSIDGSAELISAPRRCISYDGEQFCDVVIASAGLTAGAHELTVQSRINDVQLDRFSVARIVPLEEMYPVTLTQIQSREGDLSEQEAELITLSIEVQRDWEWLGWLFMIAGSVVAVGSVFVLITRSTDVPFLKKVRWVEESAS